MKKTVAFAAGLAIAFSAVFVSTAKADTMDAAAMQALIDNLNKQIATLMASLSGTTGTVATVPAATTGTTTCAPAQFTLTHKVGDRGGDVINIQKFLNRDTATQVAAFGAGSPGNETAFFGPATKRAVIAFQNKYSADVLAPVGLVRGTGYWGASSRAKANMLEQAACTTTVVTTPVATGTTTGTTVPPVVATGSGVTVSAAAQPGNSLAPKDAQAVPFTKFTLTAGDSSVDIRDITVELTGLASRGSFDKVMLLDEDGLLVGNERSLNSSDQARIGKNIHIKAGKSMTFTVAANMKSAVQAGEVAAFSVISVNSSDDVAGSLPITGAQHTINSTLTVGQVDVDNNGSDKTVDLKDENVKIAVLEINANNEDLNVLKVRLYQDGDAKLESALEDVKARFMGKEYSVEIDGDYLTVDFNTGVVVERGDSEDLTITATISGGSDDKIKLQVKDSTDIVAVGDAYGYGAKLADNTPFALHVVTISKANVVLGKTTDVSNDKVSAGSTAAKLASFDVEASGEDVTGDFKITVTLNANGATISDYSDVELRNVAVYKGSKKISDADDFVFDATHLVKYITLDAVQFDTDTDGAVDYIIKGDIHKDAVEGVSYTVDSITYSSIETVTGGDVNNTNSTATKTIGTKQTVEASKLELSMEAADDTSVNGDDDDVILAEIKVDAGNSGDDVNVEEIKLTFAVTDNSAGSTHAVALSDATKCKLYDGSSRLGNSSGEDAGANVTFYNLDLDVDKDTEKTLFVKCDLSDHFAAGDVVTVTGVSYKAKGKATNAKADGTFTSSKSVTITDGSPKLSVTSDDENKNKLVADDASDVSLGIVEFDSDSAALEIDTVTVTMNSNVNAIINGKLDIYVDGKKLSGESVNMASTTEATSKYEFTSLGENVKKDEKVKIEFKADMKLAGTFNIASVALTTKEGVAVVPASVTAGFPTVQTAASVPVVAQIDTNTGSLAAGNNTVLFAYSVKAVGGDINMGNTKFHISNKDAELANIEVKVFDYKETDMSKTGSKLNATTSSMLANAGTLSSPVVKTVDLSSVNVVKDDTFYVFVVADNTAGDDADVRITVKDDVLGEFLFGGPLDGSLVIEGDMQSILTK